MDSMASTLRPEIRQNRIELRSPNAKCVPLLLVLSLTLLGYPLVAQENYLVTTNDGLVGLYDLATNSFIESTKGSLGASPATGYNEGLGVPVRGPNNRLAFVVSDKYISVIDTTINREIKRLKEKIPSDFPQQGVITSDGKYLLVTGDTCFQIPCTPYPLLLVIDTAQLKVVQTVDLSPALIDPPGAIVAVGNKVYVFPGHPSSSDKLARVDLANYSVLPITLPNGVFTSPHMAAATPDGSTVVAFESETADHKSHTVFISTATDMVVGDVAQSQTGGYNTRALVITPDGSDPSKNFGYITGSINNGPGVAALDLRVNSPTYGQLLTDTTVALGFYFAFGGTAINSDGSRLIIVGYTFGNLANVNVVDTAKMFTDPAHALIAQLTVDQGNAATGVCTGFFSTIPPNTAPTVSGVSGNIVNDAPRQIEITGGNFQPGALVRIGSMDQLPATVNGNNMLSVTVPVNAPAGKALDIIVTNPQTNAPPDQQNQSGLLAGQFSILPNPKFHPTTQLASINADNSYSVYDLGQQTMANVQAFQGGNVLFWPAFNVDGKELYIAAQYGDDASNAVFPVDLKTNALGNAIPIGGDSFAYYQILASGPDPLSGKPIVTIPWIAYYSNDPDLHVSVIDSDSASPTFNTVLRTFAAGLNTYPSPHGMTVAPDGRFAYIWYVDESPGGNLGIMNLATGEFNHYSSRTLGVVDYQYQVRITPDGKYLLLAGFLGSHSTLQLFDLSVPTHPKRTFTFTPLPVPGHGFPAVWNYQVVGNQLYTFDPTGIVVVFNFQPGDFRERGYSILPNLYFFDNFAFSADGAYLYVTDSANDQITVFDASKLYRGSGSLLTNIRAPYYPFAMDVSPVAPPGNVVATPPKEDRPLRAPTARATNSPRAPAANAQE